MRPTTYETIANAVADGTLTEPFGSSDLKTACPKLNHVTCETFLAKHAEGNGTYTEKFVRVKRGRYRMK